jgi:hypothetical protein
MILAAVAMVCISSACSWSGLGPGSGSGSGGGTGGGTMRGTACGAIGSVLVASLVVAPPCVRFAGGGGDERGGSGVVGACPAPTWPFEAEAAKAGVEFFPVGGVIGLHGAGVADGGHCEAEAEVEVEAGAGFLSPVEFLCASATAASNISLRVALYCSQAQLVRGGLGGGGRASFTVSVISIVPWSQCLPYDVMACPHRTLLDVTSFMWRLLCRM